MLIKNLLYILQGLNYENKPFLKFAYSRLRWWELAKRGSLVWTAKSILLYILNIILLLSALAIFFYFFEIFAIIIFVINLAILPFYLILANILLWPLDQLLKNRLTARALTILKGLNLKVIGIAGSYGKTSLKEILKEILSQKYRVIATPENVNTDIGIADFIIKRHNELAGAEIFIVEMGAYRAGEIAKICELVKPDYSILTGINQAHLEKFGRLENTIKAKFELPLNTKDLKLLNFSDQNIKNNYRKFSLANFIGISAASVKNIKFLDNYAGLEFQYHGQEFSTKLLAEHNINLIILAYELAKKLEITDEQAVQAVKNIRPVKHRLEPIRNQAADVWVIDDSYNGNYDGFKSGLEVLARAKGRKLALTPGLVEQGSEAAKIHGQIGELYAAKADLVLLIDNSSTRYIAAALARKQFNNYKIYPDAQAAHDDLKNILRPGDTIIFQNDWPDAYF